MAIAAECIEHGTDFLRSAHSMLNLKMTEGKEAFEMKHHARRIALGTTKVIVALATLSIEITVFSGAAAQENALGPPDVLQYPLEAPADAPRGLAVIFLRERIEKGADLALCEALMREAGRPIPADFDEAACEPAFAEKVRDGEGIIHWAGGARPLQCGESCVGRPFMTRTQFVDRPNLRRAMLYGRLTFVADPTGPFNRDITYGYEAYFTCNAENGARSGVFTVDVKFGAPVIGDPGPIESVLDFLLLPARLSGYIERRIRQDLSSASGASEVRDLCRSVGAHRDADAKFDSAVFDPAPAGPRFGRPDIGAATALRDRATIRFLRIARKPLPAMVSADHAAPGNPAAGFFNVFLNGSLAAFPPKSPTPAGGIVLPPEGGVVELNYCRTIDLTGSDRLQLLFTNGLGGAVWSQFARTDSFGANVARTMTTGRTIVVPGFPGLPDPVTGRPTPAKPRAVILREFQLVYAITYAQRPDVVVTTEPARPGRRPGLGAATGVLGDRPGVAVDPSKPAPQPCREI
jgi:hypothetical protein